MTEIQRADPRLRRNALLAVAACAVAGTLLGGAYLYCQEAIHAWLADSPAATRERFGLVLAALAVILCAPVFGMAVYLWALGVRAARGRRYPPPGTLVARDTAVLVDAAAIRRGRVLQALGATLALAAAGLLGALWWLWSLLPGGGG